MVSTLKRVAGDKDENEKKASHTGVSLKDRFSTLSPGVSNTDTVPQKAMNGASGSVDEGVKVKRTSIVRPLRFSDRVEIDVSSGVNVAEKKATFDDFDDEYEEASIHIELHGLETASGGYDTDRKAAHEEDNHVSTRTTDTRAKWIADARTSEVEAAIDSEVVEAAIDSEEVADISSEVEAAIDSEEVADISSEVEAAIDSEVVEAAIDSEEVADISSEVEAAIKISESDAKESHILMENGSTSLAKRLKARRISNAQQNEPSDHMVQYVFSETHISDEVRREGIA